MLFGRERECARIDRLLEAARAGRAGALVVRGEAGVGKSALLEYAGERADGMVVQALGVESEVELEFSALLEICRPLLGRLDDLPGRQAAALRGVLGLGPVEAIDPFLVGASTLGLLAAVAADGGPLSVLVDDAQWLDRPSADALVFELIGGPGEDQTLVGGPGDDSIDGGAGIDMLFGGDGFDLLKGGSENDLLFGEAGSLDTLDGGPGADTMSGGDGFDIVSYQSATQRVTVDLDGQAGDDGATGEGDTVRTDVEQLNGGPASDSLTGNAGDNLIIGGDGNDVIDGGLGVDSLIGGKDNDTIRAKDGVADRNLDCGPDSDQVDADTIDTETGCEGPAAPAVGIGPKRARIDKQGHVKLTLHCSTTAVERCTGTLRLERGTAGTIASRRYKVASGDTASVRVRLDRSARRAIAGRNKLRVRAITRSHDAAGHTWTSKRTLILVR